MKTHPIARKYGKMNELLEEREQSSNLIDLPTLKGYIKYARDTCRPVLTSANT